jgi:hypothetical protein
MRVLTQIGIFVGIVIGVTDLLNLWVRPIEKRRLRRRISSLSSALKDSDPVVLVKSPLQTASILLDRIYGSRLLSWRALWRATVLSVALMVSALSIYGIASGVPFGIREPPWTTFNEIFNIVEQTAREEAKKRTDKPEAERLQRFYAKLLEFRTPRTQAIYSAAFFVLIVVAGVFSNFLCVALARKTLRDMGKANTLFTLFSLSLINFLFSFLLYAICISIICMVNLPVLWLIPILLISLAMSQSWLLAASIALPLMVAALKLSPYWMEIVSVVATLPGILVLVASAIALIAFPFRRVIRGLLIEGLSRSAQSDKAVLAFIAIAFALLAVLVSLIPKMLFGPLGLS